MQTLNYYEIQTPSDVWSEILKLNPINPDDCFYEPFKGTGSLYNQITNKKYWTEITEDKNVFDFDKKDEVNVIYSNFPFKCLIPNKKGEMQYKNAAYFFLEYFIDNYPNLHTLGTLVSSNLFTSMTPFRLNKLKQKGFQIANITVLNTNYWRSTYYFVLFKKFDGEGLMKIIPKTFTNKV